MPKDTDQFDFFVSYASADNSSLCVTRFVEELLAEYRKFSGGRARREFFDKRTIKTGADWEHTLDQGIARSRLFLAFISLIINHALRRCRALQKEWGDPEVRWELTPLTAWAHFLIEQDPDRGGLLEAELGTFLYQVARFHDAEPLLELVLRLEESQHGHDHPGVATALNNLAALLQDTNRLAEAEPLMRRHLEIFLKFTRATGHPHPHLQDAINNYG